jgi:hypothetical protein
MSTCISIGIGIPFLRPAGAGIDPQAQAHYDRVIADGGLIPSGLVGVNNFFKTVKAIYGTSDITTAISVGLDAQVLGYKLGAGAGTTAGQAAQKLYSCSGSSGDVVQTTAASQPLLLTHTSGENYWWSGGTTTGAVNAANISIPTSSGMSIEAKVLFTTNDDTTNSSNWICSNDNGSSSRNMFLGFSGSRTLILYWANLSRVATATAQIPSAFNGWVKATLETSGSDMLAKFFTSLDGINYTQLGSTITNSGGANTFQTSPATFWVTGNGGANCILGKIFRVIYKDANGVTRADFNPSQYNAATSQTQWTSSTGEVWTINTDTATTGYKAVLVDRTIMQGDGVDDRLSSGTITSFITCTEYSAINPLRTIGGGSKYLLATNTADAHITYIGTNLMRSGSYAGANSGEIQYSSAPDYRLNCFTALFNGASSLVLTNNASQVAGSTSSETSSSEIKILSDKNGSTCANAIMNTFILSANIDNSTQRESIYNAIRGINNNAF